MEEGGRGWNAGEREIRIEIAREGAQGGEQGIEDERERPCVRERVTGGSERERVTVGRGKATHTPCPTGKKAGHSFQHLVAHAYRTTGGG